MRTLAAPAPICIAGMHRSGTSMVARLLNRCGLDLGPANELLPPLPENPDGFWENIRLFRLNEELLNEVGGAWDLPPAEPILPEDVAPRIRNRAARILEGFAGRDPWGWKDPRNSLTFPFWRSLLPHLRVVICLRNPLEVAQSLNLRNRASYTFGLILWTRYNDRLLQDVPAEARIVTHYDAYFQDPQAELRRVLDFCGMPAMDEVMASACTENPRGLRHNRFTMQHLLDLDVAPDTVDLYLRLCAEAHWIDAGAAGRAPDAGGPAARIERARRDLAAREGAAGAASATPAPGRHARRRLDKPAMDALVKQMERAAGRELEMSTLLAGRQQRLQAREAEIREAGDRQRQLGEQLRELQQQMQQLAALVAPPPTQDSERRPHRDDERP